MTRHNVIHNHETIQVNNEHVKLWVAKLTVVFSQQEVTSLVSSLPVVNKQEFVSDLHSLVATKDPSHLAVLLSQTNGKLALNLNGVSVTLIYGTHFFWTVAESQGIKPAKKEQKEQKSRK